jgi:ketosteroid isomerase-like protein/quercetin dioxygenase-like cupin family protein
MKAKPLFLLLLTLSLSKTLYAQLNIDVVKVSPDNYNVLLENDQVRVVQYTLKPGQKDNPHTHPPRTSYIVSGGKLRVYPEGKEPVEFVEVAGQTEWSEYSGKHYVENIGKTTFISVLTEVKQAQTSSPDDEQKAQQAIIKMFDALSARDAAALRNQCTTDVRFYEYGQSWTADTLINKAITKNTATDFKRINKFDFISTNVKPDVAWITYNLHSEITSNGKHVDVYWLETVVLVKEEEKWKVKALHSTLIKKN